MTDRIRFLPVAMTGRFSNFNCIEYTEDRHASDRHEVLTAGGEISISGAGLGNEIYAFSLISNQP